MFSGHASVRHVFERPFELPETCDLAAYIGEMMECNLLHRDARQVVLIGELKECANVIERKGELATAANERETLCVLFVVGSVLTQPCHLSSSPAISSTRSTIRLRNLGSLIRVNALMRASPSEVARKSVT